jgi:RNA polymerase sigma-70 factor (ECF subfamily)
MDEDAGQRGARVGACSKNDSAFPARADGRGLDQARKVFMQDESEAVLNLSPAAGDAIGQGQAETLAGALQAFRGYLILIARRGLAPDLAAKVGASDLVQETFLAAGRDIAHLRGRSAAELRSWLVGILKHLLANTRRRYRGAQKRRVDLEVSCGRCERDADDDPVARVIASETSASGRARRHERENALREAMMYLPERYRQVIEWHHEERLTFETIAGRLGISPEAARKVWGRALMRLRETIGPSHDPG